MQLTHTISALVKSVKRIVFAILAVMSFASAGNAATATGQYTFTATVVGSIGLTIDTVAGQSVGDVAANLALGSLRKYGAVPSGCTRTTASTTWTMSWTVGLTVKQANLGSSGYTLAAQVFATENDYPGTWTANSQTLNYVVPTTAASGVAYGSTFNFPLAVKINDSASPGDLANVVSLIATAN
jgi:hypothetical protein